MTLTVADHLFGPGPKRVLSLDGGGILGVIEIAFLEEIEDILRRQHGGSAAFRLSDYFDLIGGTSTGAIIATALALGMSVAEVKVLYFDMAPAIFSKPRPLLQFWQPRFNATVLANKLRGVLRDETLESEKLLTGLALVAKRLDTASPWVMLNCERWKFWDDPLEQNPDTGAPIHIGNRHYKLRDIVRASTAAPFFFSPKKLRVAERRIGGGPKKAPLYEEGVFVDGAMSPHNNPALALLMLARLKAYGLNWRLGSGELMMISIGTGWRRPVVSDADALRRQWFGRALEAYYSLRGMSWDGQMLTLKLLQWISEPRLPWPIDSEIGGLEGELIGDGFGDGRRLLSFQRYDLPMQAKLLKKMHNIDKTETFLAGLDDPVNPKLMTTVYELAQAVAKMQVAAADFPSSFRADRFAVGFTGHRLNRLPADQLARIGTQIDDVLAGIEKKHGARAYVLASGLAEGADQIAAAAALKRKWTIDAVLPFSQGRYLQDFSESASRAQYLKLAAAASRVEENRAADYHPDAGTAYAAQGARIVAQSQALVTVWDGAGAHGTGGTAETIEFARSKGIPVVWINANEDVEVRGL